MLHSKYAPLDQRDGALTPSLERTPETGRLRFMDVNEAQEREVGVN